MKRRMTLSFALALNVTLLSLASSTEVSLMWLPGTTDFDMIK